MLASEDLGKDGIAIWKHITTLQGLIYAWQVKHYLSVMVTAHLMKHGSCMTMRNRLATGLIEYRAVGLLSPAPTDLACLNPPRPPCVMAFAKQHTCQA